MMVFRCFYTFGVCFCGLNDGDLPRISRRESEEEPRPVEAPVRTQPPPDEVALQAAKVPGRVDQLRSTQINWGTLGVGQGNHSNYLVIHHLLSYFDLFSIMLCHCISWSSKVCSKQLRDFFCCSTRPPGWQAGKQEHVLSGFWFSSANSIFFAVATIIIN